MRSVGIAADVLSAEGHSVMDLVSRTPWDL